MTKSKVYLKKGDYNSSDSFVEETLNIFKENPFIPGERVLLYFDGNYDRKRDVSTYPDERFLKSIIENFLNLNVHLRIGVSVFEYLNENLIKLINSYPVEIVSFMNEGFVKFPHKKIKIGPERRGSENIQRRVLSKIYLPQSFNWSNSIVAVSKIKLHPFLKFGGVVTGLLSLTPSYTKIETFFYGTSLSMFGEALSELISIINEKFKLAFLDGVEIFEKDEIRGNKKELNSLIASKDLLSLDSVGSVLVGLKPSENQIFNSISIRGLGINRLNEIDIVGDNFVNLIKKAELPTKRKIGLFGKTIFYIDKNLCTDCEICLEVCPVSAIDLKTHTIDNKKSITCFECYLRCPEGAIKIKE